MATNTAAIEALYVAYFNRPADTAGLAYWDPIVTAAKGDTTAVSKAFAASDEYKATFAGQDAYHIVATVYQNLFGHQPDTAGLAFWGQALLTGKMTIDNVVTQIAAGAQGSDKVAYNDKITAATAFTNALDTAQKQLGYSGTAANNYVKAWMATVVDDASLKAATDPVALANTVQGMIVAGTPVVNVNLTTGLDTVGGGTGNFTFNGLIGTGTGNDTITALDTIKGGSGTNVLNITDLGATVGGTALPLSLTVSGVQTTNVTAAAGVNIDTTAGFTGLTALNVVRSTGNDTVKVGAGTAVNVTDSAAGGTVGVTAVDSAVTVNAAGTVTITGGSTQTVNTAGGVNLNKATGAITVVDTAQNGYNSVINDGTNVSLTTTTTDGSGITIGNAVNAAVAHNPTGTVTVVQNLNGTGNLNSGNGITVNGGTVDTITVNATQATAGSTTTIGTVNVNGTAATTSVSVTETAAVAAKAAVAAVTGVKLADSVAFSALTAGQSVTVGGLTFTAGAAGASAAAVAAAFAGLSAGATQGNSTAGYYTGSLTGFSSGAAASGAVTFTSTSSSSTTDIVATGTGATVTHTVDRVAAVTAVTGVGGIANGAVNVVDMNAGTGKANTITSVSLNGYGSATVSSDALTSLSLANVSGKNVVVNNISATTLGLALNKVTTASGVNLDNAGAKYTALNITTSGSDSAVAVTGNAVTALTVAGSKAVDLTGSAFGALKTVTASGAAGLTMASGATVTDINASASTGAITVTNFDASKATYEGSAGVDMLTLAAGTNVTKAISLGAGNDTVVIGAGAVISAVIDGGAGTDTVSMTITDAQNASATNVFSGKVINFEVLQLTGGNSGTVAVDVLGNYNTVTSGGEGVGNTLTMTGFTTGGTLNLTSSGAGSYVVQGAGFAAGTADVFNVNVSNASGINAGTVTVNSVETLNLAAIDTKSTNAGVNTDTLNLSADSVTSIKVTGNANLVLTGANQTVTSVDASALNGGLTYTTAGGVAEIVKGGMLGNQLTAAAGNVGDTLIGGAGVDTIIANSGADTLTGNGGNDTFKFSTVTANVNTYSTITDAHIGNSLVLIDKGLEVFNTAKVTLANTAVFQDYANAVVAAGGDASANGYIGWFQFNGDTYIVESLHNGNTTTGTPSFVNGTDLIVKLTGLVDLSHTSINPGSAPVLLIG